MKPLRIRLARLDTGLGAIAALAMVLYLMFLIVPVLLSLKTSFTNQNILFPTSKFVGLANYRTALHDMQLRSSIEFTLALAVAVTIVANAAGLCFAVLLNRTSLSYRVLRTLAFLPQVISGIIAGFVWSWMLSPTGLVNHILTGSGLVSQPVNWLGTPQLAQLSAGLVVSWVLSGFTTVVYLAALQNIPRELYEASSIDGASSRQQFRMITFRMVAPATTISVVICLITVLKLYDIITALTGGGPAYATRSIAMYIISVGFSNDAYGYASAIAMVLLVLTAIIALSVTTVLRRREVEL
ncbi:MAG TPA: sugar ABC transporter permease [Streptosporangiaceae bacterium]|jgi:ABC-type sugar transport system permease subunit|nr:sugar ABC transporter permease [Streptosporangiaceae bacterium]